MTSQSIRGNQSVQIRDVSGSSIQIVYEGAPRGVPLERATVPISLRAQSPARLVRARSGVVPFAAREVIRDELEGWLNAPAPFAGQVIGGHGGTGKTRLGVELCERVKARDWLCGFLTPIADQAALEALVTAPTARLVVIDYAESRVEQLEQLLPLLAARATVEAPVRVMLLVRAGPHRTSDWAERLRNRSDRLDALLDECEARVLTDVPLDTGEREALFTAAAGAFAARVDSAAPPEPPRVLEEEAFASPLLVVVAAYLAVHGNPALPSSRAALLDEILAHEERYWRATAGDLFSDDVLPRRVVALATLAGAENEAEAAELLRMLPDLADATAERRTRLARWTHELYPGPRWWNPVEPDLLGEHLVAETFADQPRVLAGVLAGGDPESLARPLDVYARAANDHPDLTARLQPVLSAELERLCETAVAQATSEADHELLYGSATTAAAAIDRAVTAIEVDADTLPVALNSLPPRPNLLLNPLAVTLGAQYVAQLRRFITEGSAAFEPELASALNNLSVRLAGVGRREESLATVEEAVEVYRQLAAGDPAAHEPELARSLNNLSVSLAEVGRDKEALAAIEEAVEVRRRLAVDNPGDHQPQLASSLSNLSVRLAGMGRREEALTTGEEAVEAYRPLVVDNPAAHEPDLASALNNLSNRLAQMGRREEALAPIEEAVEVRRRLAAANPAAYEPDLAGSLNNLSNRLAERGRREEALAPIEEAVEIRRRLAAANPAAYEPDLARSLNNLSVRLVGMGRREEATAPIEEAVEVRRRLAAANPAAFAPSLARSLSNLSNRLGETNRPEEALASIEEAVEIYRHLVAENPAAYEPDLAGLLNNLSGRLVGVSRQKEALATVKEAVEIRRRLAAANPAAYEPDLARSLNNLSARLVGMGRPAEALAPIEEAVEIRRRLAAANPAAHEPDLAGSLTILSKCLAEAGRDQEAKRVREELADLAGQD